jgi:hypothetical protein
VSQTGEIAFRIVCSPLPPADWGPHRNLRLALQREKLTEQEQALTGDALTFEGTLRVQPGSGGQPNFLGPYAHGSAQQRFLYLVWTGDGAMGRSSVGRIKVQLGSIGWGLVEEALTSGRPLEARISGVGRGGGPAFATVSLLAPGWRSAVAQGRSPAARAMTRFTLERPVDELG